MIESSEAYQAAVIADGRRTYVKAVVDIIDPDMVRGDVTGSRQDTDVSRIAQLWDHEFENTSNYASCEPGRWILDGQTQLLPDTQPDWEVGMVGGDLSGPDGAFHVAQWAQIEFENVSILQACSVAFSDDPRDGVGEEFTVELFSDGVAYVTRTVTGNTKSLVPITGFRIMNPDAMRVTVTKWSLPGRRMRLLELVPGVYEVWTGNELAEVSVKHQGDPSCLTIPYGTATIKMDNQNRRFDPRTKDGVFLSIQERQGIELYIGVELPDGKVEYKGAGVFYQTGDGWKTGDYDITMKWNLVDIVGMIVNRAFIPPKVLPTTLAGWLSALVGQLGENFKNRYRVAEGYGDLPVTVPNPKGMLCGDILRYVCMATGTWPRADASTGCLMAAPTGETGNRITLDNLNKYPIMSANRDVALVSVNGYEHEGNNPSAPDTIAIRNPASGPLKNYEMARAILSSSCGGNKIELVGRGDPSSEVGDVDVIYLAEGNATTACRIRQELSFSNGVLKDCKSILTRADGFMSYSGRMLFESNGVFVVPDDVWKIHIVLGGAGTDGSPGSDGDWIPVGGKAPPNIEELKEYGTSVGYAPWSGTIPLIGVNGEVISESRTIVFGAGKNGRPGLAGKIWEGTITVNPTQEFQVHIGLRNDAATTFGTYTSRDGKRGVYRDIVTGNVYSGSPGHGGMGGYAGYYQALEVPGGGTWNGLHSWFAATQYPTKGRPGTAGGPGFALVYWEKPEVIEDE